MNKQTIITALLALVALAGQGQVRSGLDLCLRDEVTGEWLIGLFDEYAIYDCEYWDYAKAGKDRVVLTKDGQRKEIQMKKNAIVIDGVEHKTSVLTSKFLPDYPSKDGTPWTSGIYDEEDSVTLRVCVHTTKKDTEFLSFVNRLFDGKPINEYTKLDSQGCFEVRMPVNSTSIIGLCCEYEYPLEHYYYFWELFAVEGGDTLMLYIDDINDHAYVMGGKYARFNNELLGGDYHPQFVKKQDFSIDSLIFQQRHQMTICQTRMDSLYNARPNLSRRFRTYYQDYIQNEFAYPMLLKCWFSSSGEVLRKTEAELTPLQWMHSEVPLMCRYNFNTTISYYTTALAGARSSGLTDPADFIYQLYIDGKVQLTEEELKKVKAFQTLRVNKSGDIALNNAFMSDIIPILAQPLIGKYWDWEMSEKDMALELDILNSLDLDDETREILKAQTVIKDVDSKSHEASPRVMKLTHQEIHHPRLLQSIDNANQRIKDFLEESQKKQMAIAPKDGTPASLRVPDEELKGITGGQQLFENIVKPFKGYVIYVDVWGTWCGPCRGQMEHVPDLKKTLEGKPVVYLYFCNNSPEDSWRTFIIQKHLDTDNAVHYNLPREQESAIERYLEVSGFPTYRLVDTKGQLMPGAAPWPSNISGVVAAIEQLLTH